MKTTDPKDFRELLEVYSIGIKTGLFDIEEISKWADAINIQDEEPDYFVIELSLAKDKNEIISFLNEYCGENKTTVSVRVIFGILFSKLITKEISLEKAISILYKVVLDEDLSTNEYNIIYWLEVEFSLVHDGYISFKDVEKETFLFLANYQALSLENSSLWSDINQNIEKQLLVNSNKTEQDKSTPWYKFW